MRPILLLSLPAFAAAVLSSAGTAGAQDRDQPTREELQQARDLFIEGAEAVEAGRWADAVESFERSYELSSAPSALYNLAVALRALGRNVDARDRFDRLLTEHDRELDDEMRESARQFQREVSARIAVLSLAGLDPNLTFGVRLDGREILDRGRRPIVIETDPGNHRVVVEHPDFERFDWEGRLTDGQQQTIDVVMRERAAGGGEEGGSIFESPIFWIAAGAVVVVGAAVTIYLLYDAAQLDPQSDRVVSL